MCKASTNNIGDVNHTSVEADYYSSETRGRSQDEWDSILSQFADATIYQTWGYGAERWRPKNLSHFVLRRKGDVVAAAQVAFVRVPWLSMGFAYLPYGPMWRRNRDGSCPDVLAEMLAALRRYYVDQLGFVLRIEPHIYMHEASLVNEVIEPSGFVRCDHIAAHRTLLVDLQPTLDELLMGLKKKWRENLRRAERQGLKVIEGTSDSLFREFESLFAEMHERKKFTKSISVDEYRRIQQRLAPEQKLRIMLAMKDDRAVAGLVWSMFGDAGLPIFSATADSGLKLRGSYLLRWKMLETLKTNGCRFLDQGGAHPAANPGGYTFKAGMGGVDITNLGSFDAYNRTVSQNFLRALDKTRVWVKKNKGMLNRVIKVISRADAE